MRKVDSGQSLLGLSALGLACIVWTTAAFGLGLGGIEYKSYLGQKLKATIQLIGNDRDLDADSLRVRAVSEADARAMGVDLVMSPYGIKLKPEVHNGELALHLSSESTIVEPFIDLLVELQWPGGLIYREYTLLLDPPAKASRVMATEVKEQPQAPAISRPRERSAQSTRLQVEAGGSYRVSSGDSLSLIANRWRAGKGVTLKDTSEWILNNNPQAFIGGNANRLVAGANIQLPDLSGGSVPVPVTGTPEYTSAESDAQAPAPTEPMTQALPESAVSSGGKVYLGNPEAAKTKAPDALNRSIRTQVESAREMNDLLARENTELRKRIERIENSGYNETFEQIVNLQQQQIDELRRQLEQTMAGASSSNDAPKAPAEDNQDLAQFRETAEQAAIERASREEPINPLWWVALGLVVGAVLSALFVFLRRRQAEDEPEEAATYSRESANLAQPELEDGQFQESDLPDELDEDELLAHDDLFGGDEPAQSLPESIDDGLIDDSELRKLTLDDSMAPEEVLVEDSVDKMIGTAFIYTSFGKFDEARALLETQRELLGADPRFDKALADIEAQRELD